MKNRSRQDINAMILEAAIAAENKTKIMYKAYLSHSQLCVHLTELQDNGLLEYRLGEQTYVTTQKGKRYLEIYNNMNELTSIAEEDSAV
ncbi:MAG: winged helix-turn-helix domain-containing protein [Nitrososphaeraceae archaeon]